MSRRCSPGMRARITADCNSRGAVVLVERRYFGELVSGAVWPDALFPWVVTSLGEPLTPVCVTTGANAAPTRTIVVDDADLEPLTDAGAPATSCAVLQPLHEREELPCWR